jgi:hypothetical protein
MGKNVRLHSNSIPGKPKLLLWELSRSFVACEEGIDRANWIVVDRDGDTLVANTGCKEPMENKREMVAELVHSIAKSALD